MDLLLDTSALIYWLQAEGELSHAAIQAIRHKDARIAVSAVSLYEIAYKEKREKLELVGTDALQLRRTINDVGFRELPISLDHALIAGRLPLVHGDPFDRILAAQALMEHLTIVSSDEAFDKLLSGSSAERLW
jgi:PIN domain nuclease of toxin-antitoxin system